jgi:hypothetical protein
MATTRSWALIVTVAAAGLLSAGCLVKDSNSTLCLEPDGSVRWTVTERNIHAVADTPADRLREEEDYLDLVAAGNHPAASAFRTLGGQDITTTSIAEWPPTVVTSARFPDIARVWQDYFDRTGLPAESRLERLGVRTTWTLIVDIGGHESDASDDDGLGALLEGDERPSFFMRHAEFVEAVGFSITDDGRVAKLDDFSDRDWTKEPRLVLKLSWVSTEAVTSHFPR